MIRKRIFTYEEALELFPTAQRLTEEAAGKVETMLDGTVVESESDVPDDMLPKFQELVSEWADAMAGLGIEVKGLWLIDFDCGSGYYCWRYPEEALTHFHGYDEGFQGRVKLN